MKKLLFHVLLAYALRTAQAALTDVSAPSPFSGGNASLIRSNFFGISIELSVVNTLSNFFSRSW